ncbi:MAG: trigger factor [Alphaproteobacteria bacterium]|nr:trigger factor [Alphaproteobacteria bacterium]
MNVTETLVDGLNRQFSVVVPAQNLNWAMNQRLVELSKTMKIAGFRAGKVPVNLVRQRYGQAVLNEVVDSVVQNSAVQALSSKNLRAASRPKFEKVELRSTGELEYSMSCEILPEIVLTDLSQISLIKEVVDVNSEEVDKAMVEFAKQAKNFKPATDPTYAAMNGDLVVMDFLGTKAGVAFPGGTAKGFRLQLGSEQFIPGFEDQLVGIKAGESRVIKLSFPTDYHVKDLAGEAVEFAVTVHSIEAQIPMTVDEELAKLYGYKSLEHLREKMKARMEQSFSLQTQMKLKRRLLDELNRTHSFALPASMVEDEFSTIWQQLIAAEAEGEFDQSLVGKDEEFKRQEYRTIAERRVRLGLVLAEVGRLNNLTVTDEELRRAMREEAENYPGQQKNVMEFYRKDIHAQERLRAPLLEDKVVNFILELTKVETKTVTSDILLAEDEEEVGKVSKPAKAAKKPKKAEVKAATGDEPPSDPA